LITPQKIFKGITLNKLPPQDFTQMIEEEHKVDYQRNKTEKLQKNQHRRDSSGDFDHHVASNALTNYENNAPKSVINKKTDSVKNTKSYETRLMRSVHYSGGFN
jgi:hypothetical protein